MTSLRDKLTAQVQGSLQPGEQVRHIFMAQGGPSPWFSLISALIVLIGAKYRVVAVADRSILVLKASGWLPSKPGKLMARLPLATIGPVEGSLWGQANFAGERLWINRRFFKDVEVANAHVMAANFSS